MKKFFGRVSKSEKGFTLIELLVVVAILGVLAAVAIPNIGKFIGRGQTEAYETELHNIQTGLVAMMADANSNTLTAWNSSVATNDMDLIMASDGSVTLYLSSYMTGLNTDNTTKSTGATYVFTADGAVTQNITE